MSETNPPVPAKVEEPLPSHLHLRFWPFALAIDLVLRWSVLGFASLGFLTTPWVWGFQVLVIPLGMIIFLSTREDRARAKYELGPKVNLMGADLSRTGAILSIVTFLVGIAQIWAWVSVPQAWLRVLLAIVVMGAYTFYLFAVIGWSFEIREQRKEKVARTESWADANDRIIVHLDSERASMQQRVDTYTLESALFGALAFSAFVTIVSSEKATIGGVKAFVDGIAKAFTACVTLNGDSVVSIIRDTAEETTLLAAIAAQALLCSAFFLAVIICRLRFNDLLARTDYCVRVAMQFNAKEEEVENAVLLFEESQRPPLAVARLEQLKEVISESLSLAQQAMNSLKPVVMYMSLFRNVGVMVFLVSLITSSLWISKAMAALFAGLTAFAYIYPWLDQWFRDRDLGAIIDFRNASKRLLPAWLGGKQR